MDEKEAARSTILSKSWLAAWLTRPNLDLDKAYFRYGSSYLNFVNKTLQRYEDLNLTIDTLRLVIPTHNVPETAAKELFAKTMELAVFDLDVKLWKPYAAFPVVLRSETLGRLSLHGNVTFDLGDLTFPKLKSICVTEAHVTGDLIGGFISRHPLIERVKFDSDRCGMLLPGGERIKVSCSFNDGGTGMRGNLHKFELHKLEYMCIQNLIVEGNIFLPQFRFLKELVITNCTAKTGDYRDMQIHSTSLERISIEFLDEDIHRGSDVSWNAEFDVPNIRKFDYKGCCLGSGIALKRGGTSREWESNIHVRCPARNADAEWFIWLNQLLQKFSLSKLSLSICMSKAYECCEVENMGPTRRVLVECVRVDGTGEVDPGFIDGLLRICRPKMITIKCEDCGLIGEDSLELVRKRLNEEASLDAFEEETGVWRTFPPRPIPEYPTCVYGFVCFQLRWRPELSS